MDGYRVGDCGLVPEDRVVAFVVSKTRKRGAAPGWSRPPLVGRWVLVKASR